MKDKKTIVLSLGGSLIVPEKINFFFLDRFKETLRKHYSKYKFVVVCGGGSIARRYIEALKKEHKSIREQSEAGIRATRMNAMFLMQFFGKEANKALPKDMHQVKKNLHKNSIVLTGALRYSEKSTSDSTAAKLANHLNTDFINLTNIKGLYSDNPLINKKAKFIPYESWKDFESRALKIKYSSGQHFVLDQQASKIIRKHRIKTFIIGPDLSNLDKILKNKRFTGTLIEG